MLNLAKYVVTGRLESIQEQEDNKPYGQYEVCERYETYLCPQITNLPTIHTHTERLRSIRDPGSDPSSRRMNHRITLDEDRD